MKSEEEWTRKSLFLEWCGHSYEWDAIGIIEQMRWETLASKLNKQKQDAIASARDAALVEAIETIDSEPILPGSMPQELFHQCKTSEGAEMVFRSVVISTVKSIKHRVVALRAKPTTSEQGF